MLESIAWIVLRIVYASIFLWPIITFIKKFPMTVKMVEYLTPYKTKFFAVLMIFVMFLGGLSIILGCYGQIAGLLLMFFCLLGVIVHYRLASRIAALQLTTDIEIENTKTFSEICTLGIIGHETSAQKNYVLSAVGFFFALMGTGPWSLTGNLF